MQKSMEERLVLSVLRYANLTSPSVGAISRLTDLDNATVESLLERLNRRGSVHTRFDRSKQALSASVSSRGHSEVIARTGSQQSAHKWWRWTRATGKRLPSARVGSSSSQQLSPAAASLR